MELPEDDEEEGLVEGDTFVVAEWKKPAPLSCIFGV